MKIIILLGCCLLFIESCGTPQAMTKGNAQNYAVIAQIKPTTEVIITTRNPQRAYIGTRFLLMGDTIQWLDRKTKLYFRTCWDKVMSIDYTRKYQADEVLGMTVGSAIGYWAGYELGGELSGRKNAVSIETNLAIGAGIGLLSAAFLKAKEEINFAAVVADTAIACKVVVVAEGDPAYRAYKVVRGEIVAGKLLSEAGDVITLFTDEGEMKSIARKNIRAEIPLADLPNL